MPAKTSLANFYRVTIKTTNCGLGVAGGKVTDNTRVAYLALRCALWPGFLPCHVYNAPFSLGSPPVQYPFPIFAPLGRQFFCHFILILVLWQAPCSL